MLITSVTLSLPSSFFLLHFSDISHLIYFIITGLMLQNRVQKAKFGSQYIGSSVCHPPSRMSITYELWLFGNSTYKLPQMMKSCDFCFLCLLQTQWSALTSTLSHKAGYHCFSWLNGSSPFPHIPTSTCYEVSDDGYSD